jgi:hypothetical protein
MDQKVLELKEKLKDRNEDEIYSALMIFLTSKIILCDEDRMEIKKDIEITSL